jgi:hypothetical protein
LLLAPIVFDIKKIFENFYCTILNFCQTSGVGKTKKIMNAKQVVGQVKNAKGQHVLAVWERSAKVKKDIPFDVRKRTAAWVRAGINYANLASVKSGIEAGTRDEVGALPWGEWSEYPFIISHKGSDYVRLYPASFENLATPIVAWLIDNLPVSYEQVEPYLLASEKRKEDDKPIECFTLKADNLIAINEA